MGTLPEISDGRSLHAHFVTGVSVLFLSLAIKRTRCPYAICFFSKQDCTWISLKIQPRDAEQHHMTKRGTCSRLCVVPTEQWACGIHQAILKVNRERRAPGMPRSRIQFPGRASADKGYSFTILKVTRGGQCRGFIKDQMKPRIWCSLKNQRNQCETVAFGEEYSGSPRAQRAMGSKGIDHAGGQGFK